MSLADLGDRSARPPPDEVWSQSSDDVAARVGTDPRLGLSKGEAAERLSRFGPNELETAAAVPLWRRVGRQFTDPLVLLLLVAIAVSFLAWVTEGRDGVPLEAIVIAVIVAANAVLGTWQEDRTIKAVAALRRLAGTHSTVVRDGRSETVASTDLVCGDVLALAQGDAVGADCRLVDCAGLTIAEAALTGESTPVSKETGALPLSTPLPDRTNMAHRGTAVAAGRGVGIVVATGMSSEIGRIARLIDEADQDVTPLQREIDWLGRMLGIVVLALASIVVATIMVTSDVSTFADFVDAALVGVSLAVAAVPEGLPAILTIVLAMGVQRMAGHRAIVKRLSSVETLGSASVICTDKTGTLTRNEMTIVALLVPSGRAELTGVGHEPIGDLRSGGLPATSDVTREVELLITAGSIANDASLRRAESGGWEIGGDPTEVAFLVAEEKLGLGHRRLVGHRRVDEIPFDSDRKLMTTINDNAVEGGFGGHATPRMVFTKGAPDVLFDRCGSERVGGAIRTLTADRRAQLAEQVDGLADRALRTLAVAYRPADEEPDWSGAESELTLLGIVGITDPPRAEAGDAIRSAHLGGVRVIMITGDHPRTAARIAEELDLAEPGCSVVSGTDLAATSDAELDELVMDTNVFARVNPEHKLRLVRSLQGNGQVTAMTGDGVNDAPALKQADIGIAMGVSGTEVSKEAADMILADDNFATILRAVREEDREIFADIQKFLRYLLASNTGEVLVVFLGVMFASQLGLSAGMGELAVPLLATQILWINLVTDGPLALALGVDPSVENVMDRPPRTLAQRVIDRPMLTTIVFVGVATAVVSLVAFDLALAGGLLEGSGDVATARTMTFTTLVLAQVFNAFTARSDTVSAFVDLFANRALWAAALFTVVAQVMVVHLPGLSAAFDTEPLSLAEWLICSGLASLVLVAAEILKLAIRSRSRRRAM